MNATEKAHQAWGMNDLICRECGWSTRFGSSTIRWSSLLIHYRMVHPDKLHQI